MNLTEEHKNKIKLNHARFWEGKKLSDETKEKMSIAHTGKKVSEETREKIRKIHTGKKMSPEARNKIGLAGKGRIPWNKGKTGVQLAWNKGVHVNLNPQGGFKKGTAPWNKGIIWEAMKGENNIKWIKDRSKLMKKNDRNDYAYKEWRKEVWLRDNFKCKIANPDCSGRIEAHHILGWSEFVELRYEINNGITLCHAHHPKKRAEEKRLIPTFQELLSMSVSK